MSRARLITELTILMTNPSGRRESAGTVGVSISRGILSGRTAVVSGASQGLGLAIATALAREGVRVGVCDLPPKLDQANIVVEDLVNEGHEARAFALDVREPESVRACVDAVARAWTGIDILVNNAGIAVRGRAVELSVAEWDSVFAVNLRGAFLLSVECGRRMITARRGSIVNVASIFGLVGGYNRVAYACSKAGLVSMTRCLALEWAEHNVQVNAVAPAFANTPLTEKLFSDEAVLRDVLSRTPAGRLVTPEEVASAVVFLASASPMVTGIVLPVDGGWTSQ